MKRALLCFILWVASAGGSLAESPTPLLVGAVRDQTGDPVAGARIVLSGSAGVIATGLTGADGTFAIAAGGARSVRITCEFCKAAELPAGSGPVVAIVERYRALMQSGPSANDLEALPYAHVESSMSLRPFVVLADSRGIFPGTMISDRGLSRAGGLVVDNGVANYDIAANASPFFTMPAHSMSIQSLSDARNAFRYGDRADAGTFAVAPAGGSFSYALGTGSDGFAVANGVAGSTQYDAAVSGNRLENRVRFDLEATQPLPEGTVNEAVSIASGALAPYPNDHFAQSFAAARVSAQVVRAQRRYADITFDHGTYALQLPTALIGSQWSDGGVRAGVESLGSTKKFIEVSIRRSNGYYDAPNRLPLIAGGIDQFSVATGIRSDTEKLSVHASVAAVSVDYSGGPIDDEYASPKNPAGTSLIVPSLDAQLRPGGGWEFDLVTASTFRLPTLLERYARPPAAGTLAIDRNGLFQLTASYSDRARWRASLTAFRQSTTGFDRGSVSGIGASLGWEVLPRVSVRSWMLRETDTTVAAVPLVRFTPSGVAATVGSAWLTYDGPALRSDVIYRRDLLDAVPVSHFDFAISRRAGNGTRWMLTSEVRHGVRYNGVALRWGSPNE